MKALTRLCLSTATVAALAATTIAPVIAPPAAAAMPAECANQRSAPAHTQLYHSGGSWGANIFGEQSDFGRDQTRVNAVKISIHEGAGSRSQDKAFPGYAAYQVRTSPSSTYFAAPGYGGVDARGLKSLYVFLPQSYVDKTQTLQISLHDPNEKLPTSVSSGNGAEVTLFTANSGSSLVSLEEEFGDPVPDTALTLTSDGIDFGTITTSEAGRVRFPTIPACQPFTVTAARPPRHSKYLQLDPVKRDGLAPGREMDLGVQTVRYQRGSISVVYDDNPDPNADFPVFEVTGPAGRKTYTGDNGRLYFGNAQPGEYFITSEGTGRYSGMTLRKRVFLKPGEDLTVNARYAPTSGVSAPETATTTQVNTSTTVVTPSARTTTATVTQPVTETRTTTQVAAPTTKTETAPATTVTSAKATPSTATVRLTEAVTVTPDPVTTTEVPARLTATETTTVNRIYTTTSFRPQPLITATRVATVTSTASAPAVTRTVDVTETSATPQVVTVTRLNTVTTTQRSTEVETETAVVDTKGNLIAAGVALAAAALTLGGAVAVAIGAVPGLADVQKLVAPIGGK